MKIKLLILIFSSAFCMLSSTFAQTPNWVWAKGIGGAGWERPGAIAIDASGNVLTTGSFVDTVDFDPGPGIYNLITLGPGQMNVFISKLDNLGNFKWARSFGGTTNSYGNAMAVDPTGSGNIYAAGTFTGTVDFDPGPGVFNLTSPSSSEIYIVKLDSSGNFIWAKQMDGYSDGAFAIAIDPSGSGGVYTTGAFIGSTDFDPGPGVFTLNSVSPGYDVFISKLDSSGNFLWAKEMGGTGNDNRGLSIQVDTAGSGDVYTTGSFTGITDFDPGAGIYNLTAAGMEEIFIQKLDSSGNFIWAKRIGAANQDIGNGLAIDFTGSGDVYITGSFEDSVDFDPGPGVYYLIAATLYSDIFVLKLNSSGNFVWAKRIGAGSPNDAGQSITLDSDGYVYSTGHFYAAADFDPGPGVFNLYSSGSPAVYVSKLDSSGNFVWAKSTGLGGLTLGNSIAIDASGSSYVTGRVSGSVIFDLITWTTSGNEDIFIAKLDTAASIPTGFNEEEIFGNGILLFPNPTTNHLTIDLGNNFKNVEVTITDISGKIIYTTTATETQKIEVSTKDFAVGVYVVQIQAADFLETRRLIIVK